MDSLTDIAVFLEVVERGSFTAAADRLDLSRPVVSKYVTRLENRLGARLMNRTTRRLSLTEVGRVFYDRARRGLNEIEEAQQEISRLQGAPRGVLKVNAPMSFGVLHIAPALAEFREKYPEIIVDMSLDDRKVDIVEEGFDVSLRISELGDSSLVAKRLALCRHAIVAAPSYLEARGLPQHPDDLRQHSIVSYRYQESAQEWHFQSADQSSRSVAVTSSITVNNSLAVRAALLGGAGIARVPTFVIGRDLQERRLTALLTNYQTLTVTIYLVYPQRHHMAPKVRAFLDFMINRISEPPYWDQSGS